MRIHLERDGPTAAMAETTCGRPHVNAAGQHLRRAVMPQAPNRAIHASRLGDLAEPVAHDVESPGQLAEAALENT